MTNPKPANVYDTIKGLEAQVKTMEEFMENVQKMPVVPATVAALTPDKVVLALDGKLTEVERGEFNAKLRVGQTVGVIPNTGQIVKNFPVENLGEIVSYVERHDSDQVIVGSKTGGEKIVFCSLPVEDGDRLVLDRGGSVVVKNVGKDETATVDDEVNVSWDDVAGLDDVKEELREIIECPHENREAYAAYGYSVPKGMLLSGPPGCGKTLIGKAAATSMRDIYGGKSAFIYVKGPEILNKFVGESESNVRDIFARARRHFAKTGVPAVVFIDEAEAILNARGTNNVMSGITQTIVPSFLTEMDGMNDSGALVILATNRPDMLDPAIVREGRIDRKFTVRRPNREAIASIVEINTRKVKKSFTGEEAAAEISSVERVVFHAMRGGKVIDILLADVISGATVAEIVNRAKGFALRRDVKAKNKKISGITMEDVKLALDGIAGEIANTNHQEVINEVCTARHGGPCEHWAVAA